MPSSVGDPQFAFMITYFKDRITDQIYDPLNDVWREDTPTARGWTHSPMTKFSRIADRDWGDGHSYPSGLQPAANVATTGHECWDYYINEPLY
jgi:hypothetical protein